MWIVFSSVKYVKGPQRDPLSAKPCHCLIFQLDLTEQIMVSVFMVSLVSLWQCRIFCIKRSTKTQRQRPRCCENGCFQKCFSTESIKKDCSYLWTIKTQLLAKNSSNTTIETKILTKKKKKSDFSKHSDGGNRLIFTVVGSFWNSLNKFQFCPLD